MHSKMQTTINNYTCINKIIRLYVRGDANRTQGRCLNYDASILFIKNENGYIEGVPLTNIQRILLLPEDQQ